MSQTPTLRIITYLFSLLSPSLPPLPNPSLLKAQICPSLMSGSDLEGGAVHLVGGLLEGEACSGSALPRRTVHWALAVWQVLAVQGAQGWSPLGALRIMVGTGVLQIRPQKVLAPPSP